MLPQSQGNRVVKGVGTVAFSHLAAIGTPLLHFLRRFSRQKNQQRRYKVADDK
jgi:hypothetical protein